MLSASAERKGEVEKSFGRHLQGRVKRHIQPQLVADGMAWIDLGLVLVPHRAFVAD